MPQHPGRHIQSFRKIPRNTEYDYGMERRQPAHVRPPTLKSDTRRGPTPPGPVSRDSIPPAPIARSPIPRGHCRTRQKKIPAFCFAAFRVVSPCFTHRTIRTTHKPRTTRRVGHVALGWIRCAGVPGVGGRASAVGYRRSDVGTIFPVVSSPTRPEGWATRLSHRCSHPRPTPCAIGESDG
jgi:hypothetical protein